LTVYYKVLGVGFLAFLVGGVWLTNAIFTKQFVDYDKVNLESSSIGLQLPERADVKLRGVIVGEVLDFKPTDNGEASIELGLYPSQLDTIPNNVTAEIVPKTLFGEKYVSLDIPDGPVAPHILPGATIQQGVVSIEVEKVLSDLFPLLRAVAPADINRTLTAIATALEGRGEKIGQNLQVLDAYLKRVNPQIPDLVEDLRLTATVSNVYADVMPQIAEILRNTVTTGNTLKEKDAAAHKLFRDVAAFSDTATDFLDANGDNLIQLSQLSKTQFDLFARYAPEFPCLMKGIVSAAKLQAEAFRGFTLHINLETIPNQPRGYGPQDYPVYGDSRAPSCAGLPTPGDSQAHPWTAVPNLNDGVEQPTGKGTRRVATGFGVVQGFGVTSIPGSSGYVGSAAELDLLNGLVGPAIGASPDSLDYLSALLIGPMARGAAVSLR
jgi:phospholipid/cholesterol/gamma-HCH transport system substrate-binding protein